MRNQRLIGILSLSALLAACATDGISPARTATPAIRQKVIIFVWDGLRPDSVNAADTPNLAALRDRRGANFTDNHAVFPTFTMMNASAFATGSPPATHGFYGNTMYQPGPSGKNSSGGAVDYAQPVFTEDYGVLNGVTAYFQGKLYLVGTLFQAAHRAGLKTAAVGKSGAAFIQDYASYAADSRDGNAMGVILEEKFAFPLPFARELQVAGHKLPKLSTVNYGAELTLLADNGDPTAPTASALVSLADKTTKDPRSARGSPYSGANEYMMGVYLDYILPKKDPDLSLIWLRNPDTTEHNYGPGTPAYVAALGSQDRMLGALLARIDSLGIADRTSVIVVSDHGHTTVAGDPRFFPLRALTGNADGSGAVGSVDRGGYSVSGDVRTADLLARAGFAHVYDGAGCLYDPVLSGMKGDGSKVYPDQIDSDGSICGKTGQRYSTPGYKVPTILPAGATIVAANGGADYVYLPDHDAARLAAIVRALQSRKQYGAIFVASRYGDVPGTLPMTLINTEGGANNNRNPDLMVSFDFDDDAVTGASAAVPGTEYESFFNNRGMHGSFGSRDVHNSLFATGPAFKATYRDECPSANTDVAPTVAYILGLELPEATGRPLLEALNGSRKSCSSADFTASQVDSSKAAGLVILDPTDPAGRDVDATQSSYAFSLFIKTLRAPDGKSYVYFDRAKAIRK